MEQFAIFFERIEGPTLVCVCVCMCVHVCVCVCCMCECVCICVCITCEYMCLCVCMCVWVFMCTLKCVAYAYRTNKLPIPFLYRIVAASCLLTVLLTPAKMEEHATMESIASVAVVLLETSVK